MGWLNVSAYNLGMMGYRTPNIDRIAEEGALFTDCYGEQSCTAGRAAFVTGQSPIRTGLTKVGLPGADRECQRGCAGKGCGTEWRPALPAPEAGAQAQAQAREPSSRSRASAWPRRSRGPGVSPLPRRPLGLTVNEPLDLQHLVWIERAFRQGAC